MKKLSKWLTSLLVIAMALTMFGSSALAYTGEVPENTTLSDTLAVALTKTTDVTDTTKFTDTDSYTFRIAQTGTPVPTVAGVTPTWASVTGFTTNQTTIDKTLTGNLSADNLTGYFSNIKFTLPGDYTFTVNEVSTTNTNLSKDTTPVTVTAYVTYAVNTDGTTDFNNVVVRYTKYVKGDAKDTTASFKNTANTDTASLTVKKVVTGNTGSKTQTFTFNVNLTGVTGTYATTLNGVATTSAHIGDNSYTLKDSDVLVITGLPKNATYTVTEAATANYKAAIDQSTTYGAVNTAVSTGEVTLKENASHTFYNNCTLDVPTAFVVNNWPYMLVGIFAIAGIAFFMKKKSTKETF